MSGLHAAVLSRRLAEVVVVIVLLAGGTRAAGQVVTDTPVRRAIASGVAEANRGQMPDPHIDRAIRSGGGHPWQGGPAGVNAYSGAKQTAIELAGWVARGRMPLSFELEHSSQPFEPISDPSLGPGWMHSMGSYVTVWTHAGVPRAALVHLHTVQLFELREGAWRPMDGYRDQLVAVGGGFHVILKSQVRLEFEPSADPNRFRLKRIVDTNNNAITNEYNAAGRWTRTSDPSGRLLVPHYAANGKLVNLSYGIAYFARQCLIAYDATGRIQRITWPTFTNDNGPQSCSVDVSYDAANAITSVIDPAGNVWDYGYDVSAPGRLAWEQWAGNSSDQRQRYEFVDKTHRRIIDPRGVALELEFEIGVDGFPRLVGSRDALDHLTALEYGDPDYSWAPSVIVTPSGDVSRVDYDNAGNAVGTIDPAGNRWDYTFDVANNLVRVQEPLVTDAWGVIEPMRHRTDYGYDANHNLIWTRPYSSATEFVQTTFARDAYGQIVAITDANGHTTSYERDVHGNVTLRTTPAGRTRAWLYENEATTHGFTVPNAMLDGRGERTNVVYNERGWLTMIDYPEGTVDESYGWGRLGELLRSTGADGLVTYYYTPQGWLFDEIRDAWMLHRSFAPNGLVAAVYEYHSGGVRTILKDYDAVNRLESINDDGLVTLFEFDDDGRLSVQHNANASRAEYVYVAGRPASITHFGAAGTEFLRFERSYQANGLLSEVVESSPFSTVPAVVRYGYDMLNRLIREERTDPFVVSFNDSYTRDAGGNITRKDSSLGGITDYVRDADDLTLAMLRDSFSTLATWDESMCLTQKVKVNEVTLEVEELNFTYDHAKRLQTIWMNSPSYSGETHRFTYGPATKRVGSLVRRREYVGPPVPPWQEPEVVEPRYDDELLLREEKIAGEGGPAVMTFANGKNINWREPESGEPGGKTPASDGVPTSGFGLGNTPEDYANAIPIGYGKPIGIRITVDEPDDLTPYYDRSFWRRAWLDVRSSLRGVTNSMGEPEQFGVIRNAFGEVIWQYGHGIPAGLGCDAGWRDQGDAGLVNVGGSWYDPALGMGLSDPWDFWGRFFFHLTRQCYRKWLTETAPGSPEEEKVEDAIKKLEQDERRWRCPGNHAAGCVRGVSGCCERCGR
ncbi:MAG: hypothetical protein CHACPFDD_00264 [Phycisphaerae bacterium]|nr:hypothetical protein [Phycisphaerae bacterium]